MLLYHIPTYRLVEFFGWKNPSLKALVLLEIIKSGSLMGLEAVMVFVADPNSKQMQHSKTRRTDMLVFRTRPIACSMLWTKILDARSIIKSLLLFILFLHRNISLIAAYLEFITQRSPNWPKSEIFRSANFGPFIYLPACSCGPARYFEIRYPMECIHTQDHHHGLVEKLTYF